MAQAADGPGIDVHIRVDRMSEDYIRGAAPLSFAVSRLRMTYQLSANGSGILATQRISNPSESIDQPFTPGREPRGFSLALGKNGQPQLRVWAAGLQREVIVPARFVRGDWAALTAGAPVVLAAPVEDLQRAHGVADQLGRVVTRALRQRLENAIPFVTIQIGDMVLQDISLSRRDAIIEGSSRGLVVTYPAAEISYGAPVTVGY